MPLFWSKEPSMQKHTGVFQHRLFKKWCCSDQICFLKLSLFLNEPFFKKNKKNHSSRARRRSSEQQNGRPRPSSNKRRALLFFKNGWRIPSKWLLTVRFRRTPRRRCVSEAARVYETAERIGSSALDPRTALLHKLTTNKVLFKKRRPWCCFFSPQEPLNKICLLEEPQEWFFLFFFERRGHKKNKVLFKKKKPGLFQEDHVFLKNRSRRPGKKKKKTRDHVVSC